MVVNGKIDVAMKACAAAAAAVVVVVVADVVDVASAAAAAVVVVVAAANAQSPFIKICENKQRPSGFKIVPFNWV